MKKNLTIRAFCFYNRLIIGGLIFVFSFFFNEIAHAEILPSSAIRRPAFSPTVVMAYVERGQAQSALEFLNVIWFDEKSGTSIKKTIDSARTGPAGGGLAQIKLLVAERSIYLAARKCASLQLNPTCDVIFYTLSTDDPNFLKREILPFAAMGLVSNIDGIDLAFYKGKVYVFSTSIALLGGHIQGTYISFKQGDHWQIVPMSNNVFGQLAVEMRQENKALLDLLWVFKGCRA